MASRFEFAVLAVRSGFAVWLCGLALRFELAARAAQSGFAVWECGLAVWRALFLGLRLWQLGLASRSAFAILALRYGIRGLGSALGLADCWQWLYLLLV